MADEERDDSLKKEEENDKFVFMREEIKSRPINRKHLARNTLLAAISALVFGVVACVTFALLAPFILNRLTDEPEVEELPVVINFPEETVEEEMTPEDMLTVEEEEENTEVDEELFAFLEEQELKNILSSVKFTVNDYQELYKSMYEIANTSMKAVVRVTPIKSGTDIFSNIFEYSSELSGLIVAESEENLYILTRYSQVRGYENIVVTFINDIQAKAEIYNYDSNIDVCILTVKNEDINEVTRESISIASFSSSATSAIVGNPVIAIGTPNGTYGSVNYGIVTSNTGRINVTDNIYKQVVTNIYGSQNASGVIVNLRGDVIAYTDIRFSSSDTKNLLCGIGITELRRTIESLLSGKDTVLFGIQGLDVPEEALVMGMPSGCYVYKVLPDSPAYYAGIQSGDIITKVGEMSISRFAEFLSSIKNQNVDDEITVTICRDVQGVYKEMPVNIRFTKVNK